MRIAILGTVGAGKTTLINELKKNLDGDYEVINEVVEENPYLNDYYNNMGDNVFRMQVYMLFYRSVQISNTKENNNVLFDRSIIEYPLFVKTAYDLNLINDLDYKTYNDFFRWVILTNIPIKKEFDLIVYLQTSTDNAMKRIAERDRTIENTADRKYWEALNANYKEFYEINKNKFNFLLVDADNNTLMEKVNFIKEVVDGK